MLGAAGIVDMEPTIELEQFARLSAELDAGMQRDELCAREGMTVDQWVATQETWLSRLADETARQRFVLTNQYNAAFVARRRELTHGTRARPVRRAEAVKPALAAPPPPEPAAVAPPPIATPAEPSFVKAQQAPSYVAPLPVEPPPVMPPPVVAPPIVEPPKPPVQERRVRAATVALPVFSEPAAAPLPFKPPPPGPPPPAEAHRSEPPRPPAEDGSTTATGPSPLAVSRMALPFQPAPPAAPAAPKKSEPPRPPPAAEPEPFGAGTVVGAMSPFAAGASPLPFQGSAPAPHPGLQTSGVGLPFQPASPAKGPAAGAPGARTSPTTAGNAPRLTLEQFASLTAEIAVTPHNAAQIRARYGFDEAGHAAEAEAHNRRFSADKALYARYLELFQRFRDYVARAQR